MNKKTANYQWLFFFICCGFFVECNQKDNTLNPSPERFLYDENVFQDYRDDEDGVLYLDVNPVLFEDSTLNNCAGSSLGVYFCNEFGENKKEKDNIIRQNNNYKKLRHQCPDSVKLDESLRDSVAFLRSSFPYFSVDKKTAYIKIVRMNRAGIHAQIIKLKLSEKEAWEVEKTIEL